MVVPSDFEALLPSELRDLVIQLVGKVTELEHLVAAQREEIARLKGLAGRPTIKPSGMEKSTQPKPAGKGGGKRRGRGKSSPRVGVEDCLIKLAPPAASRFKGYDTYVVQDIVLRARVIRYRRER